MWEVMFWPIVACVLLPWLLVYLGLHVVQRGIIFVDIAMAQMASPGICVALLFRLDLHGWTTFGIALGFTLLGGTIFSLPGKRASQLPQEAIIGIAYVVAAAAAVCGINLARGTRARLLLGWIIATAGGIGGLFWSFYGDLPSGAAIVCTFGVLLVIVSGVGFMRRIVVRQV